MRLVQVVSKAKDSPLGESYHAIGNRCGSTGQKTAQTAQDDEVACTKK